MEAVQQFAELFAGGSHAHGEWDQKKGARTVRTGPTLSDYESHISGNLGLGLVPVRLDGTCRFAAIDIDVDTIDHADLEKRIKARNFPLHVCRSKSGGAHLYLFMAEPGIQASVVRRTLGQWAAVLGYPTAEVFPKQDSVSERNIGNWINLPYFGGDNSTRYCVVNGKAISLEKFIDTVRIYDPEVVKVDLSLQSGAEGMPPCLKAILTLGIPDGQRNQALFNYGVFFRKSSPQDWEEKLLQLNQEKCKPPLPNRELQTIIRSLSRTKYQYTCELEPIRSHCNRTECLKLPFGVGHMPWKEEGTFDDLLVANLRKILTDPPQYVVEVNGHDVTLETEEFVTFRKLRLKLLEVLDMVVQPMKQERWEQTIKQLLASKSVVEAPEDAGLAGVIFERLEEFLSAHERQKDPYAILRGSPVLKGDKIYFRSMDFTRYLLGQRVSVPQSKLFVILRKQGCEHRQLRVKGKVMTCWSMPAQFSRQQTEKFSKEFFEEVDEF